MCNNIESLYDIGSLIAMPIRKFERNEKEKENCERKKIDTFYWENDFNVNVKVSLAFERFIMEALPKIQP